MQASYLKPLDLDTQAKIACSATYFFSPIRYLEACRAISRVPGKSATAFTFNDFLDFLERSEILSQVTLYHQQVGDIVNRMVARGILVIAELAEPIFGTRYHFLKEFTDRQIRSNLWLIEALGPHYLYHVFAPSIVRITGQNQEGDVHAGTGLLIEPSTILTAGHVLTDMTVDTTLDIQGSLRTVSRQIHHPTIDIGLIEIDGECKPFPGLAFNAPRLLDELYLLGFPRICFTQSAALLTQKGEVIHPEVASLDGNNIFLFSAVARPGNSGGPIISRDGYVVGIVTRELHGRHSHVASFYAGIPTFEIARALADMSPEIGLPIEDYA